jgi:GT2 family glycosyltransferase
VIVQYGRPAECIECLDRLLEAGGVALLPVVIDNNPRPEPALRDRVERVGGRYRSFPGNRGFAGGANAGVREALQAGEPETIVLLNPDVRLEPSCLLRLHRALAADPGLGVVGPGLLSALEPERWWNVGSDISWPAARPTSRLHGGLRKGGAPLQGDVDFVCGAVLAFRSSLPAAVGELPEDYHLYFEDADFCLRVKSAGLRVMVLPEAVALHRGGASFAGMETAQIYYRVRNRLIFSRLWNPFPLRGRAARLAFSARNLWLASRALARGETAAALARARGVADYYRGRRGRMEPLPGLEPQASSREAHGAAP